MIFGDRAKIVPNRLPVLEDREITGLGAIPEGGDGPVDLDLGDLQLRQARFERAAMLLVGVDEPTSRGMLLDELPD